MKFIKWLKSILIPRTYNNGNYTVIYWLGYEILLKNGRF